MPFLSNEDANKVYYAVQLPGDRDGEFMFLTHNQAHMSTDITKVLQEVRNLVNEETDNDAMYDDDGNVDISGVRLFRITEESYEA